MNDALPNPTPRLELATAQLEALWNAPIGIAFLDRQLRIQRINAALAGMNGLPAEAHLGKPLADVLSPGEATRTILHCLHQVLATGQSFVKLDGEWEARPPAGQRRYSRLSCFPVHEGVEVVGVCVYVEDISDQRRANEAIRESEERLRMAVEAAAIGTWDFNLVTHELLWDARTKELCGVSSETPVSYDLFLSTLHPEDRERTNQVVQQVLRAESGGRYDVEYRLIGIKDGVERWIAAQGTVKFDARGQPCRFIGTVLDITQRKQAEASARFLSVASRLLAERLDKTEEMLQRVARLAASTISTYCIMTVVEEDGSLRRLAGAHREPSKEDFVQEAMKFIVPGGGGTSPLLGVVRTGEAILVRDFNNPEVRRRFAVSPAHLDVMNALDAHSVMTVPMRAGGKVFGVMILAAAPPQRRFDEEDLALAEELAHRLAMALENLRLYRETRQAVGLRDEFLSIASHELKTPLTSLKLQHQLIDRFLPGECRESVAPRLSVAARQVGRLSSLVDSLLDVSRITAGRLRLEPIDMELTQLIREVLDRLSEVFSLAECSVDFPSTEPVRGYWDLLRLEQVLVNLLSNAAKYGAGRPIHVRAKVEAGHAVLSIRDEGIGIAPEGLSRLFSRFGRAVSERHYGGLGLGLFISKQIIEAMDGRIRVESRPSEGATFIVELPLRPDRQEESH